MGTRGLDPRAVAALPRPWPARLAALAAGLLVAGPALGPGYVLLRDMVFVPRQTLGPDALGLGDALPRAVPVDAVMALLTTVVPGEVVQKLVLVGVVVAAALGAARLVTPGPDGRRGPGAAVAAVGYAWSPYLAERLLMGHWSLLLAWAALPWIAGWTVRWRAGEPGALPRLVLATVPAALTPTGSVLAAGVTLALCGRRRVGPALALTTGLALPWLVAGLVHPAAGGSDPAGVAAFAARAEGPGGVVLALLAGGGIWNADAVPPGRTSAAVPVLTVLLVVLALAGVWAAQPGGVLRRLVPLGVAGLVVAAAGGLPLLAEALRWATATVPGAGLLRDGQKWTAWWALVVAVGGGEAVARLVRDRGAAVLAAVAAALVAVVAVPDLAWGVGGRLVPVAYPGDWGHVRAVLAADPAPGDVLVLPVGAVRAFGWNAGRPQLDPAPRYLTRPTVVDDTLLVSGQVVDGEGQRTRTVISAAADPEALARLGIGWILVERGTPGPPLPAAVLALPNVFAGQWLDLYRLPEVSSPSRPSSGRIAAVVSANGIAAIGVTWATLCASPAGSIVTLRRRRHNQRENT